MPSSEPYRVLIIEARFYEDLADELAAGAIAVLEAEGAEHVRVAVPGALEIPTALSLACESGLLSRGRLNPQGRYHGCVALGTVIRGETTHYETVANESTHWLMQLATAHHIPLGNGILTVESAEQAWARARGGAQGKGGDAARACLRLIDMAREFHAGN